MKKDKPKHFDQGGLFPPPYFQQVGADWQLFVRLDWRIYSGISHLGFSDINLVNKITEVMFTSVYKEKEKNRQSPE